MGTIRLIYTTRVLGPRGAMRIISAAETEDALDYESLIEQLWQAFRGDTVAPPRHRHAIESGLTDSGAIDSGYSAEATLLLMPAWQYGRHIGI